MRIWKYKRLTELLENLNDKDHESTQENYEEINNNINQEQTETLEEQNSQEQTGTQEEQSTQEQTGTQEEQNTQEQTGTQEEQSTQEQTETQEEQNTQEQSQTQKQKEEQGNQQEELGNSMEETNVEDESQTQGKKEEIQHEDTPSNQQKNDSTTEPNKIEKKEESSLQNEDETNENATSQIEEKTDTQLQKELLQKLRDELEEYKKQKEQSEIQEEQEENHEESEEPEEIKNEFLESLKELPSFEDRSKGKGYSIDTENQKEVSEVIIKTLINKFLNQRFKRNQTDLNVRSNSLEKTSGFYKWEIKDVITHLETEQYTKVLQDKYGYDYSNGKDENVPLSFYFDMSGSMSSYSSLLAIIAIELLKRKVKVLVGFNEEIHVQIESIDKTISVKELVSVLESAGSYYFTEEKLDLIKNNKISFKLINKNIDDYLISKKAEKTVIFSDFDSLENVIELSKKVDVYYFCFEKNINFYQLERFNGFIYPVQKELDLEKGLIKVNQKRFKSLIYLDNPKSIKRR